MRKLALAMLLAAVVTACTVGQDYVRPDVAVPAEWRFAAGEAEERSNVAWWDQFQDPVLSSLVRIALANNKDLKIATAAVDQAFAQYGIVRSSQFPQVTGGASATRTSPSEAIPLAAGGGRRTFNDFGVNLSASFELDLWGRLRRATESARASLLRERAGPRYRGADARGYRRQWLHSASRARPSARDRPKHVPKPR
jgi:multidrug efflux system outer membrane protein